MREHPVPLLVTHFHPLGFLVSPYPHQVSGVEKHITEVFTRKTLERALSDGDLLVHTTANSIRMARPTSSVHGSPPVFIPRGALFGYLSEKMERIDQRATTPP